jgi:hypothetical protein
MKINKIKIKELNKLIKAFENLEISLKEYIEAYKKLNIKKEN